MEEIGTVEFNQGKHDFMAMYQAYITKADMLQPIRKRSAWAALKDFAYYVMAYWD
jgi:hypothetical protein